MSAEIVFQSWHLVVSAAIVFLTFALLLFRLWGVFTPRLDFEKHVKEHERKESEHREDLQRIYNAIDSINEKLNLFVGRYDNKS